MRQAVTMGKYPPSYIGEIDSFMCQISDAVPPAPMALTSNTTEFGHVSLVMARTDQQQYRPRPETILEHLNQGPSGRGQLIYHSTLQLPHTAASILEQEPAWAVCDCSPKFPAGPSNHHSTADSAKDPRNPHA